MAYRELTRVGPKTRGQLKKGEICAACKKPFKAGQFTTLIALGPGPDPEAREHALQGRDYNAVAIEVHWVCATGEDQDGKDGK